METPTELEEQVMALPDSDRARLASRLLLSLVPVLDDSGSEESYQEALRRRSEIQKNPDRLISFEQLKRAVGR